MWVENHTCCWEVDADKYLHNYCLRELSTGDKFYLDGLSSLSVKVRLSTLGNKLECDNPFIYTHDLNDVKKRLKFEIDNNSDSRQVSYDTFGTPSLRGVGSIDNKQQLGNYSLSIFGDDSKHYTLDAYFSETKDEPRAFLQYVEASESLPPYTYEHPSSFQLHVLLAPGDLEEIKHLYLTQDSLEIILRLRLQAPNIFLEWDHDSYGRPIKFLRSISEIQNPDDVPSSHKLNDQDFGWEEISLPFSLFYSTQKPDKSDDVHSIKESFTEQTYNEDTKLWLTEQLSSIEHSISERLLQNSKTIVKAIYLCTFIAILTLIILT